MRVIVVGAGIMGLSAAWALRRRGDSVIVLEQAGLPNAAAASFGDHRIIRHPYGSAAGYAAMVDDAYLAWDALWDTLGERLYVPTGLVVLRRADGDWVRNSVEHLARQGRPFRRLSRDDLARALPLLRAEGIEDALLLAGGGVLLADRILAALIAALAADGAELRHHVGIREVDPERGRVTLDGGATLEADAVVIAAGAWVDRLAPSLPGRIRATRRVIAYLDPPRVYAARWTIAPIIIEAGADPGFYAVPPVAGTRLEVGDLGLAPAGDPDADRVGDLVEAAPLIASCRARLQDFDRYQVARLTASSDASEPAARFLVERLAARGWLVSAGSGHGFAFGPLLGQRLAAAIAGETDAGALAGWAAAHQEAIPGQAKL